jgi:hypothetical protein
MARKPLLLMGWDVGTGHTLMLGALAGARQAVECNKYTLAVALGACHQCHLAHSLDGFSSSALGIAYFDHRRTKSPSRRQLWLLLSI